MSPAFNKSKLISADLNPSSLPGVVIDGSDPVILHAAVKLAVDYRGDMTITRKSTSEPVIGFVFDLREADDPEKSVLRMIPKDGSPRMTIEVSDIGTLAFTGKDTAAGKSFETWMKKYVNKKLAGETASIESESDTDQPKENT